LESTEVDDGAAIRERLNVFLNDELGWGLQASEVHEDLRLIGKLDSLGLFQLVSFLEDELGIEISNEELVRRHFETIGDVVRLVQSKKP
jgi:acyl carrier protein